MVRKVITYIIGGILLASYVFFFAYWGCSRINNSFSNEKLYKNEKGISIAKERLKPVIEELISENVIQEHDVTELEAEIVDDYLEKYGKNSFHCRYSCTFFYNDYYIELGCNYYPEMNRSIDYQCTMTIEAYSIFEFKQNELESVEIDFSKIAPLLDAISKYLLDDINSNLINRYYNKQALIEDLSENDKFASSYNCVYQDTSIFYSIRDCRSEIGSHYNKKVLPDGIDGYISFSVESTLHY